MSVWFLSSCMILCKIERHDLFSLFLPILLASETWNHSFHFLCIFSFFFLLYFIEHENCSIYRCTIHYVFIFHFILSFLWYLEIILEKKLNWTRILRKCSIFFLCITHEPNNPLVYPLIDYWVLFSTLIVFDYEIFKWVEEEEE